GVAVVCMVLMRKLGYLTLNQAETVARARRRNQQLRLLVKESCIAVGKAETPQELWGAVKPYLQGLGASRLGLRLGATCFEVEHPERSGSNHFGMEFPIELGERELGAVVVAWCDGRVEVDRDEELAMEVLTDQLAEAWARVMSTPDREPRLVSTGS